jgi:dynein heavy chain
VVVVLQECGRMNDLITAMARTLDELTKGLNGQLNMSQPMEDLASALRINQVPGRNPFHQASWEKLAWPSMKDLQAWYSDMILRCDALRVWQQDLKTPFSLWMPGLFNPTAFLTAIKQVTIRAASLPLDKMGVETHMTTMTEAEQATGPPVDGMYVHGLFMEGARWGEIEDPQYQVDVSGTPCAGILSESKPKELLPAMPLIYIKAVLVQPNWEPSSVGYLRPEADLYNCPVYLNTFRGPTYVFSGTLKTIHPKSKWVLAACALMMQLDT